MKIAQQSVEYVDHMGSDINVVNAARVSFHKVTNEITDKDVKLIKYLADHNHWSPFAHAFLSVRCKTPLFIARQLGKHQVGLSWNEVSRRYVDEEPEFWFPEEWRKRANNVKQGSSSEIVDVSAFHVEDGINVHLVYQYNNLLAAGVAPELARMVLPQNMMTEWIWSGSVAAFMRVINLRKDPHAQLESQQFAALLGNVIQPYFPHTYAALLEE